MKRYWYNHILGKSVSVLLWYSYLKIGKVKSPKNRLESVSVRIGKGWIGLKNFFLFFQA